MLDSHELRRPVPSRGEDGPPFGKLLCISEELLRVKPGLCGIVRGAEAPLCIDASAVGLGELISEEFEVVEELRARVPFSPLMVIGGVALCWRGLSSQQRSQLRVFIISSPIVAGSPL